MYNWYPINFYDAREGEVRDNQVVNNSCATNGVMNAVEIDVGNLKQWLAGSRIGISGTQCGLCRAEWICAVFLRSPGHAAESERPASERSGHQERRLRPGGRDQLLQLPRVHPTEHWSRIRRQDHFLPRTSIRTEC